MQYNDEGSVDQPTTDDIEARLAPGLMLRIGEMSQITVPPTVLDATLIAELLVIIVETPGEIAFDVIDLPNWPDAERFLLLQFIHAVGDRARVRVGDEVYADGFEAALAAMAGPADLAAHARSLRAAREAAALNHPEVVETAAARINGRLQELGANKVRSTTLEKEIRALAGAGAIEGSEVADAQAAAQRFVHEARQAAGLADPEAHALVYLKGDFLAFNGRAWDRVDPDRMRARVTRMLQRLPGPKVTGKLIADTMANLVGMTLLDVGTVDMPFLVEEWEPAVYVPSRSIIFQNGVLDVEAVLDDPETPLGGHDPRWLNESVLPFDYDPDAQCPGWKQFLKEVLPRTGNGDKRRQVLQEFMGYTLLADCRFQRMLILTGSGRNGKSVVLKVWGRMLVS